MVNRTKMSREERAKQFAPFDSLKGLHEALKMKEYEHDKKLKSELPQEEIEKISKTILELKNNDKISLIYYFDGYEKEISGLCKINIDEQYIKLDDVIIYFDDIIKIKKI